MIKIQMGGSPCTHWSVAKKDGRETEASGIGWELFKNYLIALQKYKPDYFLYENVKSMSNEIKEQISYELGCEPILINSALVSAQNRQRYYWTNIPGIEQPKDRGILLRDILESGMPCRNEKSYCLDACYYKGGNLTSWNKQSGQRMMVAEPVGDTNGKSFCLTSNYLGAYPEHTLSKSVRSMVAEPVCLRYERTDEAKRLRKQYEAGEISHGFNEFRVLQPRTDKKSNTISTVQKDNLICEPVRVGDLPNAKGDISGSQATRIYSVDGKSVCLQAGSGGQGARTGLYAIPIDFNDGIPLKAISGADGKSYPVYEVKNGYITIKDKQYKIKLSDGFYIIRKLTVLECMRLQTVPEWYQMPCSATQNYKMLGNGWTIEVIKHILSYIPNIQNEGIEVLSMYDGMSCGQIALKEMGCNVVRYYASEIDKYAMQTTMANFTGTIQLGDAFQVREDNWSLEKIERAC